MPEYNQYQPDEIEEIAKKPNGEFKEYCASATREQLVVLQTWFQAKLKNAKDQIANAKTSKDLITRQKWYNVLHSKYHVVLSHITAMKKEKESPWFLYTIESPKMVRRMYISNASVGLTFEMLEIPTSHILVFKSVIKEEDAKILVERGSVKPEHVLEIQDEPA